MPALTPVDEDFVPGQWYERTFGPINGNSFAASANAYFRLPFMNLREIEVNEVGYRDSAVTAVAGNFALGWAASGTAIPADASGAIPAGRQIHDNLSLLTATTPANTLTKPALTAGAVYSLPPGSQLYIWSSADQSGSALANLMVTIRFRVRPYKNS